MTDPNAELVGFQYTTAEGTPAAETVTVIGTPSYNVNGEAHWMENYVTVRFASGHETIKPVVAVRQRKTSDSSSNA
jgi:hypothetical protein